MIYVHTILVPFKCAPSFGGAGSHGLKALPAPNSTGSSSLAIVPKHVVPIKFLVTHSRILVEALQVGAKHSCRGKGTTLAPKQDRRQGTRPLDRNEKDTRIRMLSQSPSGRDSSSWSASKIQLQRGQNNSCTEAETTTVRTW